MLVRMFVLNLAGGGADYACAACLSEARRERAADGVVSVAKVAPEGVYCGWCGEDNLPPAVDRMSV